MAECVENAPTWSHCDQIVDESVTDWSDSASSEAVGGHGKWSDSASSEAVGVHAWAEASRAAWPPASGG